jgi:hypothetical protein
MVDEIRKTLGPRGSMSVIGIFRQSLTYEFGLGFTDEKITTTIQVTTPIPEGDAVMTRPVDWAESLCSVRSR